MKKIVPLSLLLLGLGACNPNPSKEARIQQLESELERTLTRVDSLESAQQQLTLRMREVEGGLDRVNR